MEETTRGRNVVRETAAWFGGPPAGWLLLLAALAYFLSTVSAIDYSRTAFFGPHPGPDMPEYLASAVSFASEGHFRIHLAGREFPSRYPFGYSFLIALWIAAGGKPILGPFAVNQAVGLALLVGIFWIFSARGRPATGGLAALTLATLPAFIVFSRSSMSDLSGAAALLAAYLCLFRHLESGRSGWGVAGGCLLGLASAVRLASIGFAFALLGPLLAGPRKPARERFGDFARVAAGFLVGILPLLIHHRAAFGSITATGYGFWVPNRATITGAFGWSHLWPGLANLLRELADMEGDSLAFWFGEGSYFGVAFAVLAGWGLWLHRREAAVVFLAFSGWIFGVAMTFYFYADIRLYFPLILLAVPLCADAVAKSWRGPARLPKILAAVLLLSHLAMYPSRSFGRAGFGTYLDVARTYRPSPEYELVGLYNRLSPSGPVLVLTDMNPAYFFALTGGDRVVTFLLAEHDYRFNPAVFQFGKPELAAQVRRAIAEDRRILAVCGRDAFEGLEDLFPAPAGRVWSRIRLSLTGGGIAELEEVAETGPR